MYFFIEFVQALTRFCGFNFPKKTKTRKHEKKLYVQSNLKLFLHSKSGFSNKEGKNPSA